MTTLLDVRDGFPNPVARISLATVLSKSPPNWRLPPLSETAAFEEHYCSIGSRAAGIPKNNATDWPEFETSGTVDWGCPPANPSGGGINVAAPCDHSTNTVEKCVAAQPDGENRMARGPGSKSGSRYQLMLALAGAAGSSLMFCSRSEKPFLRTRTLY